MEIVDQSEQGLIRNLQSHYRTGKANLGTDFFAPCLKRCTFYRRAVGYFSSGALITWAAALPRLAHTDTVKIHLLISPVLSVEDRTALEATLDDAERTKLRQMIADNIIEEALTFVGQPESVQLRLKLLAWMVATDRLILRFAFAKHIDDSGIFHEKIGIFDFPWGDQVAFTGSANETHFGHSQNYETIDVYRSWLDSDKERVIIKVEQFEDAWSGRAPGLRVLPLSAIALQFVKIAAPADKPSLPPDPSGESSDESQEGSSLWHHQDEAVAKFLEVEHGVLEMATGTGKTRTALSILAALDDQDALDGAIITTDGTDLLHQWCEEIDFWASHRPIPFRVLRHYASHHELGKFVLDPVGAVLIISREQLATLFHRLDPKVRRRMAIIHDEVHGLGAPQLRKELVGEHAEFRFRLGLSATPEREYDQEGSAFIIEEIGDVFFRYEIRNAIEDGILCEFNYIPLQYELTPQDRSRLRQVYRRQAARAAEGRPMSPEEVWIELSRVYKTAEQKPAVFSDYVREHPEILKSTIIFVETKEYGNALLNVIHRYTHLYRTYYSEDDRRNLIDFSRGLIDCLITCHRLSQGIDIRNLKNIVLFASSRARLETIQRIGRCLRVDPKNPSKCASVVDFVRLVHPGDEFPSTDQERCDWLRSLAEVRRK
jgi:superfamily II DNA or RNA helicase